jgi:MFS family permease
MSRQAHQAWTLWCLRPDGHMTTTETFRAPLLAKLLVLGSGIVNLANSTTIPFLAVYLRQELGLSVGTVGFLVGSSVFFAIFAGFLAGALSDLLGRNRVLLFALLGVSGSFAGLFFSGDAVMTFVFNSAISLCTGSYTPVGRALMSDLLPSNRRVKWFSYQYFAINAGYAIGPLIGVALGLSGARPAFLIGAFVYLGYAAILAAAIRFGPTVRRVPSSTKRAVRKTLSGLRDSAGAVIRDRRLLYFLVAAVLLETVHNRISALLAQHFVSDHADGALMLAAVMTTNAVTVVAFQLVAGAYVQKRDPARSISLGGVLMFAGMAGFAFASELWSYVAAMVVFTIGETFVILAEFAIIDRLAPENRRGTYFGAQTFAQLGGFFGPYLGGLLLAGFDRTVMFLGIGSLALVSVAIYLMAGTRFQAAPTTTPDDDLDVRGHTHR